MILFILYAIGALLIGIYSTDSLGVYLTILPIQYFFMRSAWKSNNLVTSLFFTYFFAAIGVGSVMLYLDRGNITNVGTNHVGNFDFSYSYLFTIYAYLFVFQLVILFTSSFRKSSSLTGVIDFAKEEANHMMSIKQSMPIYPLLVSSIAFALVSVWMFKHNIGMIGLKQVQLPYHLTGILYYSRRFLFTLVLLWLFTKTRNRPLAIFILIVYSLIVAVTGSSKSINLILLVPVGVLCIMSGQKKMGIIAIVFSCLIYTYVTCTREIVYLTEGQVSLMEVFYSANELFIIAISDGFSYLIHLIAGVTGSMYGLKNVIIGYQYESLNILDTITYFSGSHLKTLINDMPYELYGVNYSADKAYGVCIGFPGTMVMMSNHSFIAIILEALLISGVLFIYDTALNYVFKMINKVYLKMITLLVFLFCMMTMIEANQLLWAYIGAVALLLIRIGARPNSKYYQKHYAKIITN